MQTVPSLVGTGTAVAAAATGFVFGQPIDPEPPSTSSSRPFSSKTRASFHDARSFGGFTRPLSHAGTVPPSPLRALSTIAADETAYHPPAAAAPPQQPAPLPPHDHHDRHQQQASTWTSISASTSTAPSTAPSISTSTATATLGPISTATSTSTPDQVDGSHHSRTLSTQFSTPKARARRLSLAIRSGDSNTPMIVEDAARDSISLNVSWMRRLSSRPHPQQESPRPSVSQDSQSVAYSHESGTPILSPTSPAPASLPPNKLVKRAPLTVDDDLKGGSLTRRRIRGHLSSLRRPATSHQRSTLQQFQQNVIADSAAAAAATAATTSSPAGATVASPRFPFDQHLARDSTSSPTFSLPCSSSGTTPTEPTGWSSFFHAQIVKVSGRMGRPTESGPISRLSVTSTRIRASASRKVAHLMHPSSLSTSSSSTRSNQPATEHSTPGRASTPNGTTETPDEDRPSSRVAHRSISTHFTSPASWIPRTGSIRRLKQSLESRAESKWYPSTPTAPESSSHDGGKDAVSDRAPEPTALDYCRPDQPSTVADDPHGRGNSSSPIPPISRVSSFNVDLKNIDLKQQLAPPAPILPGQHMAPRNHQPSGSSQGSSALGHMTINSYDSDARCFTSTDDDETMWDSIRTGTSARVRNTETPLECLFDESPAPPKTRRLSVQEMLGLPWEGQAKIMEEDEGAMTPIRRAQGAAAVSKPDRKPDRKPDFAVIAPSSPDMSSVSGRDKDGVRMSLDDDFDDDWAKDDEDSLYSPLSPPSKGNSLNAKAISPNVRLALANISGNGGAHGLANARGSAPGELAGGALLGDLLASNRSDTDDGFSDNGMAIKPHLLGVAAHMHSGRARSASGRHDADRGGRQPLRRGHMTAHTRSHSVPVVQDAMDPSKQNGNKFGTWGLGSKPISEDWDDDFDFGNGGNGAGKADCRSIAVPASIQATQPSVKAHSGQIKEFSMLVNDLKRLCRHGKDLGLVRGHGPSPWKEAEGIITLASPDDDSDSSSEDKDEDSGRGPSSLDSDPTLVNPRFLDEGFDAASLQSVGNTKQFPDVVMSKTAVVRERSTVRRRSVFSPEDDIFGTNLVSPIDESAPPSRPRTPGAQSPLLEAHDLAATVKSVVETVHRRASRDKPQPFLHPDGKVHFGSGSLKALVDRASHLRNELSDLIRAVDPGYDSIYLSAPGPTSVSGSWPGAGPASTSSMSPLRTPRRSINGTHDNPAFTRVFADPPSSPPRRLPQSHSTSSMLSRSSLETSPSSITQCMQMMTVS